MPEKISLASFEFDDKKLLASLERLQEEIYKLNQRQKDLATQTKKNELETKTLTKSQNDLTNIGKQASAEFQNNKKRLQELNAEQENLFKKQKTLQIQGQSLNSEYKIATNLYQSVSEATQKQTQTKEAQTQAVEREIKTIQQARANNSELLKLRNNLNLAENQDTKTKEENIKVLQELNQKINENNQFIKQNVSAYEQQKINIGNYKNDIKEALSELNIFNGGLVGFSQRANQAGGVTNLLSNSIKKVTSSIFGMIKASLTFLATPIGAVIGAIGLALGLVVNYLKNTQSGIDLLTKVTQPLSSAFSVLMEIAKKVGGFLVSAFTEPQKHIKTLVDFVQNSVIKQFKAFGKILEGLFTIDLSKIKEGATDIKDVYVDNFNKITSAVGEFSAELQEEFLRKQEIQQITKELAKSEADYINQLYGLNTELSELTRQGDDLNLSYAEREEALQKAVKTTQELNKIEQNRIDQQRHLLQLEQQASDITDQRRAEIAKQLNELTTKQKQFFDEEAQAKNKIVKLKKKQAAEQTQIAQEQAQKQQKIIEEQLQKQKTLLDIFTAEQIGTHKKTLQQQLDLDRQITEKSKEILLQELNAKKISKEKYALEILKIDQQLAKAQAEIITDNAKRELDSFVQQNQSKLKNNQLLTDELLTAELEREQAIADQKNAFALTQYQQGIINQTEYQTELLAIKTDFLDKEKALQEQHQTDLLDQQKLARTLEHQSQLLDLENNAWDEFEKKQIIQDQQREIETAKLKEQLDNGLITHENYLQALENLEREHAKKSAEINFERESYKNQVASQTLGNLGKIAGENSKAGKAFAVAQTTIDTYQSAIAAYKSLSGIPIVGPALGAVASAAAIKTGLDTIKKIKGTKEPKTPSVPNTEIQAFATGGIVQSGVPIYRKNGDNVLITAKKGEVILNEKQRDFIGTNLLQLAGVPGFANGGLVGLPASQNPTIQNQITQTIDLDALTNAVQKGAEQGSYNGSSQGSQNGLTELSNNREIMQNATF